MSIESVPEMVHMLSPRPGPSRNLRRHSWITPLRRWRQGEHLQVVENTIDVHNLVVCTLCSCYPWTVLGLPPVWYKSAPYRSRAVSNPRSVLTEFGTKLDLGVKIRVWDSTSEIRYLVLPMRPPETEGWTIEQLGELVTRNSMIGVEQVKVPDGDS